MQPFEQPWTNELVKVKEKLPADVGKSANDSFVTGWVGGAGSKGKIKEKKFSMHESSRSDKDDEPVVCELVLLYYTVVLLKFSVAMKWLWWPLFR